jgi:hypothetical protein
MRNVNPKSRMSRYSRLVGKAGEYAVAVQLLLRDILPLWPSVDLGYDLETDGHCRLQVRCSHLSSYDGREACYNFLLKKTKPIPKTNTQAIMVPCRAFAEVCDFVVFWGIEQNRFWIVPSAVCDELKGIRLGANGIKPHCDSLVAKIRLCENDWDKILEFDCTAREMTKLMQEQEI